MTSVLEELMKEFCPQDYYVLNECNNFEEHARRIKDKMQTAAEALKHCMEKLNNKL